MFRFAVTDSGQPMDQDAIQQLLGDSLQSFSKVDLKGGGIFFLQQSSKLSIHSAVHLNYNKGGREMGLWISRRIISMHQVRVAYYRDEVNQD